MLQYWKKNKTGFYSALITSCIFFLISLFHLKKSRLPVAEQLLFNFEICFGIVFALYLINFFISYIRYKKLSQVFSSPPFSSLGDSYKVLETRTYYLLIMVELIIRGQSQGYPVSIEYEKGIVLIIIGIEAPKENTREIEMTLANNAISLDDLGVIRKIPLKAFTSGEINRNVKQVIEEIVGILIKLGLRPYQIN